MKLKVRNRGRHTLLHEHHLPRVPLGNVGIECICSLKHYSPPERRNGWQEKIYKKNNELTAEYIGRGGAWLDTGSIDDYYKTIAFVQAIENRQGLKIACLEEIAFLNKWIGKSEILKQIKFYGNCDYSNYLKKVIKS